MEIHSHAECCYCCQFASRISFSISGFGLENGCCVFVSRERTKKMLMLKIIVRYGEARTIDLKCLTGVNDATIACSLQHGEAKSIAMHVSQGVQHLLTILNYSLGEMLSIR